MNLDAWRTVSPLLRDLDDESFTFLESIAEEVRYPSDAVIFRVNTPADRFFMVVEGTVALRMAGPARPAVTIQTVRSGGVLGLSWQAPPHLWQWTGQAVESTSLAMFDATTVRTRFETSPELELALMRVLAAETMKRLQNVRLQLLDVYGVERT